jgi:trimeric autotransporter adhesin
MSIINQISSANTFSDWLTSTQGLIEHANFFSNTANLVFETGNNVTNTYISTVETYNDTVNTYSNTVIFYNQTVEVFNTTSSLIGPVSSTANAAYTQANTATTIGTNAYNQANTATTTAVNAYNQANTATTIGTNAYNQANTATTNAGNAYNTANAAYSQANTATTIANNAFSKANGAYDLANTAVSAIPSQTGNEDKVVTTNGSSLIFGYLYTETATPDTIVARNADGNAFANTFINASDARSKENIRVIENALDMVKELEGVRFKWKNRDKEDIGLIAQEVEKVVPEVVYDSNNLKSLNYSGIIPVLIEAIKELNDRVIQLENK